jgi:hypothetical protein
VRKGFERQDRVLFHGPTSARRNARERRSDFGDVDDRSGKGLWGFLRQIVPHTPPVTGRCS